MGFRRFGIGGRGVTIVFLGRGGLVTFGLASI